MKRNLDTQARRDASEAMQIARQAQGTANAVANASGNVDNESFVNATAVAGGAPVDITGVGTLVCKVSGAFIVQMMGTASAAANATANSTSFIAAQKDAGAFANVSSTPVGGADAAAGAPARQVTLLGLALVTTALPVLGTTTRSFKGQLQAVGGNISTTAGAGHLYIAEVP